MRSTAAFLSLIPLLLLAPTARAGPCVLPDNGAGTVDLPPECPDGYRGPMRILDGLPMGDTIEIDAALTAFMNIVRTPGGTLNGEIEQFNAILEWELSGTGSLVGFQRSIDIMVTGEIHTGPRNAGDPVQVVVAQLFDLTGVHYGDPDFCTLEVRGGLSHGLPSPGEVKLTKLPTGDFAVDSFFDITYEIEFEGCPGGQLEDLAGQTTDTQRFRAGGPHDYGHSCVLPDNGSGTIDLPPECPDGYVGKMYVVAGLAPGDTIEIEASLTDFSNVVRTPGGTQGGEVQHFDATLQWDLNGTGGLAGFHRVINLAVDCETHTAPANSGDPVQIIASDLHRLYAVHYGDPDFCTLEVRAGTSFALPGPGQTMLVEPPTGDFAVDSFFDINYQIQFEGCPGGQLEDLAGTTTDTQRFRAGEPYDSGHTCVLPDNGAGTIDLPPECRNGYLGTMQILDGLLPGDTIEIDAVLTDLTNIVRAPGGSLGGEVQQFDATLEWDLTGTGGLTGFHRVINLAADCEMHTGPRNSGDSYQVIDASLVRLTVFHYGDPDFCTLEVRAGSGHALPSPGMTTLTRLPSGDFVVDSFFDITYEIEFEGCPDSQLADRAGTTIDSRRFQAGEAAMVTDIGLPAPPVSATFLRIAPNPFYPTTRIRYAVPASGGRMCLGVYDVQGRLVRELVDSAQAPGRGAITWDGRNAAGRPAAAGIYFTVLKTEGSRVVRKMTLVR